jgi:hypothetical protein
MKTNSILLILFTACNTLKKNKINEKFERFPGSGLNAKWGKQSTENERTF